MSDSALPIDAPAPAAARSPRSISAATIAWRNLWRNRRRTWLTAGGIAFAGLLVVAISSLQTGAFEMMIDNTARFFAGHLQIQHPDYLDDPRLDRAVANASARMAELAERSEFEAIAPRAQAFALLARVAEADSGTDPPAVGGLVVGVDPRREFAAICHVQTTGRYLEAPGEAYLGAVLAKNLGVATGDEIMVVGNSEEGGVAALTLTVVGTFSTGQTDFDRAQMHVHLDQFQSAFGLADAVHGIAATLKDAKSALQLAATLGDGETTVVTWQQLLPEVHQMAELKYQTTYMIYALLVVLVTFSIVNAFIMTTFERTPEFGMLKALGMTPAAIMRMLSWEALWMALLGLAITFAISAPLLFVLSKTGVSFGDAYADMTAQFLMPERLYPTFQTRAALEFSAAVLVLTQVAALIPALRLRRLRVVDALRAEE